MYTTNLYFIPRQSTIFTPPHTTTLHVLHNFFTSLKTHPFQPRHTTTHQCHFPLNWHMKMNRVETKGEVVRKPVELHSTTTKKSLLCFYLFKCFPRVQMKNSTLVNVPRPAPTCQNECRYMERTCIPTTGTVPLQYNRSTNHSTKPPT